MKEPHAALHQHIHAPNRLAQKQSDFRRRKAQDLQYVYKNSTPTKAMHDTSLSTENKVTSKTPWRLKLPLRALPKQETPPYGLAQVGLCPHIFVWGDRTVRPTRCSSLPSDMV